MEKTRKSEEKERERKGEREGGVCVCVCVWGGEEADDQTFRGTRI